MNDNPTDNTPDIIDWPTDEGVWMANFKSVGWFPIRTMFLRCDLPTADELRRAVAGEVMPLRPVIAVVAQVPQPAGAWAYTFQSCHPANEWRRLTLEELDKARKFYGEEFPAPLLRME